MSDDSTCLNCYKEAPDHVLTKTRGTCANCHIDKAFELEINIVSLVGRLLYGLEKSAIPYLLKQCNAEQLSEFRRQLKDFPPDDDSDAWGEILVSHGDRNFKELPQGFREAAIALRKILAERKKS